MTLHKFNTTPLFTKAMVALPYEEGLEFHTTYKTRYGDVVNLGYRDGNLYYVPRQMVFSYGEDLRSWGDPVELKIKYPPKNEQQVEILTKSKHLLDLDQSHILQAGTGTGKTYLSLHLAAYLGRRTLVVVTKDRMVQQWKNEITKFLGIPQDQIGHIQQDKCLCKDKPITVAMLHSLCRDKYPEWIKDHFGFIVFDECFHPSHELLTTQGWKSVAEVTKRDLVAQVDGVTGEITYTYPYDLVRRPFKGNLVRFENANVDLLATPNHEHLVYWKNEVEPRRVPYADLVPANRWSHRLGGWRRGDNTLSHWERFCLAYQADGTYLGAKQSTQECLLRFSFRKQRKVERLEGILAQLDGVRCKKTVNSRGDISILVWSKRKPFNTLEWVSLTKGSDYYSQILEEIVEWNGWKGTGTHSGLRFYQSAIEVNADRIQQVALLAGKVAKKAFYRGDAYRVTWFDKVVRSTKGLRKTTEAYEGDVYCVRVTTGFLVTRRNGKIAVTGNCHNLAAETFSRVAGMFSAKYRLGLSATPKRSDRKEFVFAAHIGPVGVVADSTLLTPKIITVETDFKLPLVTEMLPGGRIIKKPFPVQKGKLGRVLTFLAKNQGRNQKIVNFVKQAYDKGRYVVVFTELVDKHLKPLQHLLVKEGIPYSDIGLFSRSAVGLNILDEQKHKRVVLTTYGQCSEAIDVPRWDTVVLALPRVNVKQTIGRALREHADKSQPVILDLIDVNVPVLRDYYRSRTEIYKELGAEIIKR